MAGRVLRGFTFSRLRYRLLLLVLLAVLPALVLIFATDREHQRLAARDAQEYALRLARLASDHQARLIEGVRPLLLLLAENADVQNHNASVCSAFLSRILGRFPLYTNIGAITPSGEVSCSARPLRDRTSVADAAYFRRALAARHLTISGYLTDRITGRPVLTVSYPAADDGGWVRAIVFAGLDLGWVEHFAKAARFPQGTVLTIIGQSGLVLARHPEEGNRIGTALPEPAVVKAIERSQGEGTVESPGLDGVPRLFAFAPLSGPPPGERAYVSVGIPRGVAFADAERLRMRNLLGAGVAFVLVIAAALIVGDLVILRRVKAVVRAAKGLSAGDLSARARVTSGDEIGQLAGAFNEMAERLAQVVEGERLNSEALGTRVTDLDLLNELGGALQACLTLEEAYEILGRLLGRLFPRDAGMLFVYSDSRNHLDAVVAWGAGVERHDTVFAPEQCWGLRSGRCHLVEDTRTGVRCAHLRPPLPPAYLCVPLVAQGEALGVLHLGCRAIEGPGAPEATTHATRRLAEAVAAQLALGVANVKLREVLRSQSIRDPLTGLFNRRYMEETLERELRRAVRGRRPIAVLMLDLDRFKHVNDRCGHAAGDALLRGLGALLQDGSRREDVACRYGGEEFVLVLPGTSLEDAGNRAEQLRVAVKSLRVPHEDARLGSVSVSIGVAAYPDHALDTPGLLKAADAALYRAKREGRDRVTVALPAARVLLDSER